MFNVFTDFYQVFDKSVSLNTADKALCETYFSAVEVPKNTILETENKTPKHLYFLNKGFMRLFYIDENGEEVTTLFGAPLQFITPFLAFIHKKKTNLNLECITDCQLLKIERPRLVELIDKNANFKQFSLIIFEKAIADTQMRANDLATLSAEQRYRKFMETSPDLIQNVPLRYISSYLGIKPQSLSRIRKQIIK